jgi:glycosyltransferase involved in cell wall biosynthesis
MFKPVVVIPVYNHPATIGVVVRAVLSQGQACLLVDDGSDAACAAVLDALAASADGRVHLVRLASNRGKGGAMVAGLLQAASLGYGHALQIDADGQHDSADIPRFLALARAHPLAVICGCPLYDDSVPRARLWGRYATHVWVWINTLSFDIRDSMCGLRVYPLDATAALLRRQRIGSRMDFDTDIVVRLHWRGLQIVNQPTRVTYPPGGISHFRLWRDNLLISRLHTLLFLGMLWRLPLLLWRRSHRRDRP